MAASDKGLYATGLVTAASAAILATVFIAEYGFDLFPCTLCFVQRVPYAAVMVLGALALMPAVDSRARRIVLFHLVGLFALEAALAIYHVGVEAHVWQGPITCIGKPAGLSATDMMSALGQPGHPNCDEPAFILMGISLAGYNVIASIVLFGASLFAALRKDWWRA